MKDVGADRNAGFYPADSHDSEDDSAVDVLERSERPASPPRPAAAKSPAATSPAATPPAARAPVQETTPAPQPAAEAPKVDDKAKSQPEPAPKKGRRRAILALAFLGLLGAGGY